MVTAGDINLASQKGMSIGSVRHVGDIKSDKPTIDSPDALPKQSGLSCINY